VSKTTIPFTVGHCVNCGAQTVVQSTRGVPIKGLEGTYLIWIALCKEDGIPITRVGTVTLCQDCPPMTVDPRYLLGNLSSTDFSGLHKDDPELQLPFARIEVIKRYGD